MYETEDLYLAAALMVSGCPRATVTKRGHRATFAFPDSGALRETVAEYYAGRLTVSALSFSEMLRTSKAAAMNVAREVTAVTP